MDQKTVSVFIMMLAGHMRIIEGQENCKGYSIPICSKLDKHGSTFLLSGTRNNQNGTGCYCILTFNESSLVGESIAINVRTNPPAGCQNGLQFIHNSTAKKYTCNDYEPMYNFRVSIQDKLTIKLVSGKASTGGFAFCFTIYTTPELNMRLVCNKPSINGMTPTTTTTETKRDTAAPKSTQPTNDKKSIVQSKLGVIIGGSVGGLTVIIVIIFIILCVVHKRRKDKTYESPEAAEADAHPYQDLSDNRSGEITHPYQNIPDNRSEEITHPYQNIPDNRSEEITHQPKQNSELVNHY